MKPGQHDLELTIHIKGVSICDESSGHGRCFLLQLPYTSYASPVYRQVWVEESEIVRITGAEAPAVSHTTDESAVWGAEYSYAFNEISRNHYSMSRARYMLDDEQRAELAIQRADAAVALLRKTRAKGHR